MSQNKSKSHIHLYLCAAAALPCIFLFYLFNGNKYMNYLFISHFLLAALVLALVSTLLFFLFRKITASAEGAVLMLLPWWLWFWFFGAMANTLDAYLPRHAYLLLFAAIVLLMGGLAVCFARLRGALSGKAGIIWGLAIVICGLFLMNVVPALYTELYLPLRASFKDKPYDIKTEFTVDLNLPSPNIYWLHVDEGMGFSAVEKYFNDPQEGLKAELTSRGFVLNESAHLNGGYTDSALPAMFSPNFHDSYYGAVLSQNEHLLRRERNTNINKTLNEDGVYLHDDIIPRHELFQAFAAKDYRQIHIAGYTRRFLPLIDILYDTRPGYTEKPLFMAGSEDSSWSSDNDKYSDFRGILKASTPLTIVLADRVETGHGTAVPYYEEAVDYLAAQTILGLPREGETLRDDIPVWRMLMDSFAVAGPKICYVEIYVPHALSDGRGYTKLYQTGQITNPSPDNNYNVDLLYLPQYKYGMEVLLLTMDLILAHDPTAVIMAQGDHGIHIMDSQWYMLDSGKTQAEIIEMNHSTISALRIPDEYAGFAPWAKAANPLNVSRLLVNSYVGPNYDLLEED